MQCLQLCGYGDNDEHASDINFPEIHKKKKQKEHSAQRVVLMPPREQVEPPEVFVV